jgi:hypothetical protein
VPADPEKIRAGFNWLRKLREQEPLLIRYPDKVDDPDLKLVSVVIGCIDKWLPMQKLGFPPQVKWGDITRHVQSKRTEFR